MKSSNTENKYKYWMVTLQPEVGSKSERFSSMDIPYTLVVEAAFATLCEEYVFQLEKTPTTDKYHYQCCLKLLMRKRQSTLLTELRESLDYETLPPIQVQRMMGKWEEAVAYCTKDETRVPDTKPYLSSGVNKPYAGSDIAFLEDSQNWYPWQKELFEYIFDNVPSVLSEPDDREIVWITDEEGNSGKSKFVKFCCFHNKNCTKISFGSAGQLRSAIIHAGAKKCYFVDMPRTLGTDDSLNSVLSALEDTLNGFVVSSYYGESKTLLMEPPHVVVFSNMRCPYDKLSSDRWRIHFIIEKEFRNYGYKF